MKERLKDIEDRIRWMHMHLIGVPDGGNGKHVGKAI